MMDSANIGKISVSLGAGRLNLNDENVVISSTEEKVEYADDKLFEEKSSEVNEEYIT